MRLLEHQIRLALAMAGAAGAAALLRGLQNGWARVLARIETVLR